MRNRYGVAQGRPLRIASAFGRLARNRVPKDNGSLDRRLTRRYFGTRSPASARDFSWWSGLNMADARRGIDIAGAMLERVTIGERHYWMSTTGNASPRRAAGAARLLPNYDEYFIAYKDRGAIAVRIGGTALVMGAFAGVPHVVIVDGQLVGKWKRALQGDRAVVTVELGTRVSRVETQRIADEATRLSRFLEKPVEMIVGRASRGSA
jgi:hypothetical protein